MSSNGVYRFDRFLPVLRKSIGRKRFLHTLGTLHLAAVLADRFGEDPYRAIAAALFHDSGRLPTLEEVASEMHRRGIEVPTDFQAYPKLWHALLSEHRAEHDFGIRDEGVLRAIRIHSTGDAGMTRLDRILFVSDYIEPMRNFEGLDELRALAHRDLDAAFRRAIEMKLGYIRSQNRPLHPLSAKALEAAERDPE